MVPTCSHCGEEIKRGTVQARMGPGASAEQRERAKRRAERRKRESAQPV
jgi:hypothetical protein